MSNKTFGGYIREARESKKLPLRKVAAHLDIDTSTLSKIERGERSATPEFLKPLATILSLSLKEVQTNYIQERIIKDFGEMEHLSDGLKATEKLINKKI